MMRVALRLSSFVAMAAAVVVAAGCDSATKPSPPNCGLSVSVDPGTIASGGGSGVVNVVTQSGCGWTATADAGWITNLTPTTGSGSGEVRFDATPNSDISSRSGQIKVNGVNARITQSGTQCQFDIAPRSQSFPSSGGSGSVAVSAGPGCNWGAITGDPWVTITSGSSGSGDGIVRFSIQSNSGLARLASIAIGDQTAVISQQGSGSNQCTFVIQPTSASMPANAGTTAVAVTAGSGCSWTAASNASWLGVAGGATGIGNGTVTVSASANPGNARTGTVTIAGQTFIVTQSGGCSASLSPASQSFGSGGGAGTNITVTIAAGCAWSAATQDSWITIGQPSSGNGNGTVSFSVAANSGVARAGFIAIADQTFTVNQAGSCAVSINPANQSLPSAAGAGAPIAVTAAGSCVWTATTSDSWITITGNAVGSGNGTVNFTVAENTTGAARSGAISIGNQTHIVNQAATDATSVANAGWPRNVTIDNPQRR